MRRTPANTPPKTARRARNVAQGAGSGERAGSRSKKQGATLGDGADPSGGSQDDRKQCAQSNNCSATKIEIPFSASQLPAEILAP